ncbi:MAG TPA: hypothetical protein VEG64_05085 [Candidatus Sulfotelmatobacter sp.]|nr:hypothetical protein [Candidatus Sulfotelmatobacter sp.]
MNGIILGFEIALGVVLLFVLVRVLFGVLTRGFPAYINFHAWSEKHPTADTFLFFFTALLVAGGLILWIMKTVK